MTIRDKIVSILAPRFCGTYCALGAADALIAALPDYDAQQARIKELEAYLKLNKQKGDAQDRKLEAQKQLALKGEET